MAWLKVDDKLPRNPKILAGDIETAWYFVCAMTHCAEQLTDGFIARSAVPLVAPHITDPQSVADRCVTLGLFRQVEDGYWIPDYLEYNPSREQVMAKREADRERQNRRRGKGSNTDPPSHTVSRRDAEATSGVSPRVPSRPVPDKVLLSSSTGIPPDAAPLSTGPTDDDVLQQRIEAVACAVVELRFARQTSVRNPKAWRARCSENLLTDDDGDWWTRLEHLVRTHQADTPISILAAAADGDTPPTLTHWRTKEPA